jgi:small-conductance mechanosensitive channel
MGKVEHRIWEGSARRWGRGGVVWAGFGLVVLVLVLAAAGYATAAGAAKGESAQPPRSAKLPEPPPGTTAAPVSGATSAPAAPPQPVLPLTSDQVAGHMGETVDWFHHLAAMEQLQIAAGDAASRDKLHQESLTAVELAFDFGKACAALLDAQARQMAQAAQAAQAVVAAQAAKAAQAAAAAQAAKGAQVAHPGEAAPAGQSGQSATTAAADAAAIPPASKGFAGRLDQAAANVAQRITALQAQSDALNEQISHARKKEERETLVAQQGQVTAALHLAREVQSSVQDMEDFESSSIAGDNGNLSPLDGQIADMERSVPEAHASAAASLRGSGAGKGSGRSAGGGGSGGSSAGSGGGGGGPGASGSGGGGSGGSGSAGGGSASAGSASGGSGGAANAAVAKANNFRADSAGVIALITEWFSLHDMRRQLADSIKETADLQQETEKVRATLTNEVRTLVGNGLAISTSTDPAQLLAQRQALEADTARFKQLSTVLVPLGEQALTVESAAGTLDDWQESLESRMATIARYLALRIGVVLGWIAVVLIVSEVWRRATFRYLHDVRRQRQFLALRRVAVGIALTLVIVFGLVSEIGSIATYIGFVTAGVAVALQNVILAVVAYFFLIGRYGVRVGDRITLAGVTGRVVDIGLVRIYLMELSGPDLHATGRMVVLSNAVLFQPTALFKQIPGADYVWHTVTLTIAATADVIEAHKRLKAASEAVYDKYRAAIERQHAVVQRFIDFDASSPQPEVRVRLTENGLECSVRYPVELENAAVIDQQMLKALRDALEADSQFKLVSSGAVVLKSSD